ncbi:hypothetical protein GCM10007094_29590 [Pseudovibrio japonicus]|uniref:Uncharacterized protein n=1 Tax=Pseudovibrio japonicus TaxID=366534 RepID=A0ABQ3EGK1_9HYPH|nr:hypothetical protein GCM10007094_29590 [Pseudovibrio japonicus]
MPACVLALIREHFSPSKQVSRPERLTDKKHHASHGKRKKAEHFQIFTIFGITVIIDHDEPPNALQHTAYVSAA